MTKEEMLKLDKKQLVDMLCLSWGRESEKTKIINEVTDYIKNNMLYKYKYDGEELFEVITSEYAKRDLLKILEEENGN